MTKAPKKGYVRVRAAVAINSEGIWNVEGFSVFGPDRILDDVLKPVFGGVVHWIEVDVPLPSGPFSTLKGRVVP